MKIYSSDNLPGNATLFIGNGITKLRVTLRVPKTLKTHLGVIKTSKGNYVISKTTKITEHADLIEIYFQMLRQLQIKARDMKIRHLRDEQFILKQGKQLTLKI